MGKIAAALVKYSQERKDARLPKLTQADLGVLLNYNRETGHLLNYNQETGQVGNRSMDVMRTRGTIQRLLDNKLIFPGGRLTQKGLQVAEQMQERLQPSKSTATRDVENQADRMLAVKIEDPEDLAFRHVPKTSAENTLSTTQSDLTGLVVTASQLQKEAESNTARHRKSESPLLDESLQESRSEDEEAEALYYRDIPTESVPEAETIKSSKPITAKTAAPAGKDKTDKKEEENIDQTRGRKVKANKDREPAEVRHEASMPGISLNDRKVDSNLVALLKPQSYEAEQFKILRTQILFPISGKAPRSILVTSARSGDGKSFVAANLAVSIALNVNQHVLLIDGDLRKPEVHRIFGFSELPGLSSYLMEKEQLGSLIVRTSVDKLNLLPGGPEPPNPSELMCTKRMSDLIEEVKARYQDRLIVIDSPPPHLAAETPFLARQVDSVLLVVKHGKTPRRQVEDLMETVGAEKIAGVVVNQVDAQLSGYSGYKKYYKNGKSYYK